MPEQLRISVRFLDGTFHGRGDGGVPEWPPSPLRLYQAIVASAAPRSSDASRSAEVTAALRWFEQLPPPTIVAACRAAIQPHGYRLYVPDNVGDLVAKSWSEGRDNDVANYRTDKFVCPTRLDTGNMTEGESSNCSANLFPAVHYLWSLSADENRSSEFLDTLISVVHSISRLGWGVDIVVADAVAETDGENVATLFGERWLPVETSGGSSLRVPVAGSLAALNERHASFLGRIRLLDDNSQSFVPVPPLPPTAFRAMTYRRESELDRAPYAIFALRKPDDSAYAMFDPQWRRLHLAGMLRHAASQGALTGSLGWNEKLVDSFVLGHDKSDSTTSKPSTKSPRLVFMPLPSIEWRGEKRGHVVGAIRRVLVTVQGNWPNSEFLRIVRALEGCELIDEKEKRPVAFLRRQSETDQAISDYSIKESSEWTTVTPVVLPGHDDPRKLRQRLRNTAEPLAVDKKEQIVRKLDARIERLLRKALLDAGLPAPLVTNADLQWSESGFFPGADLASRYSVPDHCRRFRRLHVRVSWREQGPNGELRPVKLAGPFCIGSGKFAGLGLFVPVHD